MVAADMSGQGIGRRLLEHIEAQAPSSVTRFSLFTGERSFRNQRLYQAAGYTVLDGDDPFLPEIPITVRMIKPAPEGLVAAPKSHT
jgi:GNAT superfamily N-acetyltransferase